MALAHSLPPESGPFGLSSSIMRCFIDHMAQRLNCSVSIFQALIQYTATVNRLGVHIFSEALGGLNTSVFVASLWKLLDSLLSNSVAS